MQYELPLPLAFPWIQILVLHLLTIWNSHQYPANGCPS